MLEAGPVGPSDHVLDLFAVPGTVEPLPGGQGRSVRAGDLVLSPDHDAATDEWLSPLLARLALRLDEERGRRRPGVRIAMPVPARDGAWVVDGWAATRFEPGAVACRDLEVTLAAGHLVYARLAAVLSTPPGRLSARSDRWSRAERVAFGEAPVPAELDPETADLVARAHRACGGETIPGPAQLVHRDLAGNVLIDAAGAPLVIDFTPAWRPVRWADAISVLDSVLRDDASRTAVRRWTDGADRVAMLRAIVFRLLSDDPPDVPAYAGVLASVTS